MKTNSRDLSDKELENLYYTITSEDFLIASLNRLGNNFFMIDFYEENDTKFTKLDKITDGDKMIQKMLNN